MKRILLMIFRNIFLVPYAWCKLCYHAAHPEKYTDEEQYALLKYITLRANRGGNVKIAAYGVENIPEENGFMFFPNHQGLFDMLALFASCPRPLSVVIKKEASGWILVKDVLAATRSLSMDREDIKDQVRIISEVGKRVKSGENFVIFAEGHRSRKGNEILEFKSGTFKSVMKANCPIVPVALINSFRPFDINSLERENVEIHYLPPIMPEEYKNMKTSQIAQMVHDRIEEEIRRSI